MRRVLMVVLALAVAVGVAAPASAQTKVRKDRVGEVPANVDLRSVKVQNNAENLAITARISRVQRGRTALLIAFRRPGDEVDREFFGSVEPSGRRSYDASIESFELEDGTVDDDLACKTSVKVRGGTRGYIRVVIPQTCLGESAGRQTVNVGTFDTANDSYSMSLERMALRGDEGGIGVVDGEQDFIGSQVQVRRGR